MSLSADIWEVMAEEIGASPADREREIRLTSGYIRYGTGDSEAALLAAEIDPDKGVSGDSAVAFACKHYDVSPEDLRDGSIRRTAVVAARASIATRLASAGWSDKRIAGLMHGDRSSVISMLNGGRGYGKQARSRIIKDFVGRRPRPRPRVKHVWKPGVKQVLPAVQAVHTLRRLRGAGEEQLFPRVMKLYFPKLDIDEVYDRAFGAEPLPLTLDEARTAEARGEGTIKFVGGVPTWQPVQVSCGTPG